MAQDKIEKCLGLVAQYNPLTMQPGALQRANDCYIRRENIIEDRRGHKLYGTLATNPVQLMSYSNTVLAHRGTNVAYDNGAGVFADYAGANNAPTGQKMRFIEQFSNLYTTTDKGVKVFTDVLGTAARSAGAPRCLDPSYALNAGSTGFLAAGFQTAYRCCVQRTDANSNSLRGYPSTRLWVTNPTYTYTGNTHSNTTLDSMSSTTGLINGMSVSGTGIPAGTTISNISGSTITLSAASTATATGVSVTFSAPRNVDLTIYLPSECIAGDVIEFYRTAQVSGTASDLSADEMALVYQVALASADISAGFITFTDSITDALRGASLYTSPSQEGIAQANDRPPVCKDIGIYKSYSLYANTQTKQRLFITMVGTSSLTGNTITLGGVTYNFGSTEIISGGGSPQIAVGSTGVAAVDIDTTARSLVRVINRYASNTTVYAYYQSGPGDLPGQILIEEKGIGAAAFTVQGSNSAIGTMFFPAPPVSPATNSKSTSSNQIQKNAVYYSKSQQGEHVPTLNYLLVGQANKNILRIAPLRDSTIVIKEEGVYRISGETPQSFVVVPIDLTVFCKSVDSVAILGNQVYMLSNQGIVAISDNSVQVISRDIEQLIAPLLTYSSIGTYTTGFAYESERSYFISTMTNSTDTSQTQTFVYNYFTKTWVRHTYAINAAIVGSDDKMYLAKPSDLNVYQERKSFTDSDYADPEYSVTISSIVGSVVKFISSSVSPKNFWALSQNGTSIAIQSFTVGAGFYTATLASSPPSNWTTGAATLYPSVGMDIQWHPWIGMSPDQLKQVRQIGIMSDSAQSYNSVTSLIATFSSNFDNGTESVPLTTPGAGWGAAWGSSPWGGTSDTGGYPTWVPKNKQYCTRLTLGVQHPTALERLSIAGACFSFEMVSERIGR